MPEYSSPNNQVISTNGTADQIEGLRNDVGEIAGQISEGLNRIDQALDSMPNGNTELMRESVTDVQSKVNSLIATYEQLQKSVDAIRNSLLDNTEVLTVTITLFAVAIAGCLAYLTLPDFRYRNRLALIVKQKILVGRFEDNIENFWLLYSSAGVKKLDPSIRALATYLRMPRGLYRENVITEEELKFCEHLKTKRGWLYRKIYERHLDNGICTILLIAAAFGTFIATAVLLFFPEWANAQLSDKVTSTYFKVIVFSLASFIAITPFALACLGHFFDYKFDKEVDGLINGYTNAKTADSIDKMKQQMPQNSTEKEKRPPTKEKNSKKK